MWKRVSTDPCLRGSRVVCGAISLSGAKISVESCALSQWSVHPAHAWFAWNPPLRHPPLLLGVDVVVFLVHSNERLRVGVAF